MDGTDGALVIVTSEPVCPVIPPPSVVEAAHQSGHVIRLHVKSTRYYIIQHDVHAVALLETWGGGDYTNTNTNTISNCDCFFY